MEEVEEVLSKIVLPEYSNRAELEDGTLEGMVVWSLERHSESEYLQKNRRIPSVVGAPSSLGSSGSACFFIHKDAISGLCLLSSGGVKCS